jgi:putative SOS response-associated peptidase YedK
VRQVHARDPGGEAGGGVRVRRFFGRSSAKLQRLAPTQEVTAVLAEGAQRRLEVLRWGLIPRGRTIRS